MLELKMWARSSFLLWVCAITFLLIIDVNTVSAAQGEPSSRGLRTKALTLKETTQIVPLYSGYHAMVVGCGDYRKGWPQLPNPVQDARDIADGLKSMGWQVDLLENPTASQLRRALTKLVTGPGKIEDRGILFWFSGHGYTLKEVDGSKLGYVVPVDAPDPDRDLMGFMEQAINMRQIETIAKGILAKHVLMVFDSCFSGAIFQMVRAKPSPYLEEKAALPVRQFITSGSEDEKVPDKSTFKICFLQGILDGFADRNKDSFVTGEELGAYLQEQVVNYTNRAQHPQFGKINNPLLDKGDFVFVSTNVSTPSKTESEQVIDKNPVIVAKTLNDPLSKVDPDSPKQSVTEGSIDSGNEAHQVKVQLAKIKELAKPPENLVKPQMIPTKGRSMMSVLSPLIIGGGGSSDYSQRLSSLLTQLTSTMDWINVVPATPVLDSDKAWSRGGFSGPSPDVDFLCKEGELAGLDLVLLVLSYARDVTYGTEVDSLDVYLIDVHSRRLYVNKCAFGAYIKSLHYAFSDIEKTIKESLESYRRENHHVLAKEKDQSAVNTLQTTRPEVTRPALKLVMLPALETKRAFNRGVFSWPGWQAFVNMEYQKLIDRDIIQLVNSSGLFVVSEPHNNGQSLDNLWERGFTTEPDIDVVCQLGKQLGVNAVLTYKLDLYYDGKGSVTIYLFNVGSAKKYSLRADIAHNAAPSEVSSLAKGLVEKAFEEYKSQHIAESSGSVKQDSQGSDSKTTELKKK